jgi:hypothetical protein
MSVVPLPDRCFVVSAVMHARHAPKELLSASVFIYFEEYSDTEQPHTYPSEKLVETVGTAVTLMECMMAEVAHFSSVEQHITAAIKNSIDFEWMWCKRANRLKSETVRQRATEEDVNPAISLSH